MKDGKFLLIVLILMISCSHPHGRSNLLDESSLIDEENIHRFPDLSCVLCAAWDVCHAFPQDQDNKIGCSGNHLEDVPLDYKVLISGKTKLIQLDNLELSFDSLDLLERIYHKDRETISAIWFKDHVKQSGPVSPVAFSLLNLKTGEEYTYIDMCASGRLVLIHYDSGCDVFYSGQPDLDYCWQDDALNKINFLSKDNSCSEHMSSKKLPLKNPQKYDVFSGVIEPFNVIYSDLKGGGDKINGFYIRYPMEEGSGFEGFSFFESGKQYGLQLNSNHGTFNVKYLGDNFISLRREIENDISVTFTKNNQKMIFSINSGIPTSIAFYDKEQRFLSGYKALDHTLLKYLSTDKKEQELSKVCVKDDSAIKPCLGERER